MLSKSRARRPPQSEWLHIFRLNYANWSQMKFLLYRAEQSQFEIFERSNLEVGGFHPAITVAQHAFGSISTNTRRHDANVLASLQESIAVAKAIEGSFGRRAQAAILEDFSLSHNINASRVLFDSPLWPKRGVPKLVAELLDQLDDERWINVTPWAFFVDWYRDVLGGDTRFSPLANRTIARRIFELPSIFWGRRAHRVVADLGYLVREGQTDTDFARRQRVMRESLLALLAKEGKVIQLSELSRDLERRGPNFNASGIRIALHDLISDGLVERFFGGFLLLADQRQEQAKDERPPSVPNIRPAAIEPEWHGGKLVLPKEPIEGDLESSALSAALSALREDLTELVDDSASFQNIDLRPIDYIRRLANRIPNGVPPQTLLFRLGHARDVLESFTSTTDEEWPDFLGGRYRQLILQYDRTVRQFPQWREFVRNASDLGLTGEQISHVDHLLDEFVPELGSEDASRFIDPSISVALQDTRSSVAFADWKHVVEAGKDRLAADLIESVNNVLKRVAEVALALHSSAIRWVGSTLHGAVEAFGAKAQESIIREAGKFGEGAGPALGRFLRRAVLVITGSGLIAQFGWLEPVVRFLRSI